MVVHADTCQRVVQSVKMMEVMNDMMEDFVRRSVAIRVNVASQAGYPRLTVTATNLGRIPLTAVMLRLAFSYPDQSGHPAIAVRVSEGASAERDVTEEDGDFHLCAHPMDLAPGATLSFGVAVKASELRRLNVCVLADFPSPSSGRDLETSVAAGIGLVHQCRFAPAGSPATDQPEETEDLTVPTAVLRSLLSVPADAAVPFSVPFDVRPVHPSAANLTLRLTPLAVAGEVEGRPHSLRALLSFPVGSDGSRKLASLVREELQQMRDP